MYTGYLLTDESRNKLKHHFPPKNSTWLGHHITEKFGVPSDYPPPKQPSNVEVIGYVNVEGLEAFLVSINNDSKRPSGGQYHITWSIDKTKGVKPAHSNKYIHLYKQIDPIQIEVIPKTFAQSTEKEIKNKLPESFLSFYKKSKNSKS